MAINRDFWNSVSRLVSALYSIVAGTRNRICRVKAFQKGWWPRRTIGRAERATIRNAFSSTRLQKPSRIFCSLLLLFRPEIDVAKPIGITKPDRGIDRKIDEKKRVTKHRPPTYYTERIPFW